VGPAKKGSLDFGSRPSRVSRCRPLPGELKIIAAILERPVIEKILTHLGLFDARGAHLPAVKRCKRLDDSDP
jgi:hypothetical protein